MGRRYYVFVSPIMKYARLHSDDCAHARKRSESTERPVEWRGPYSDFEDAFAAMEGLNLSNRKVCRDCCKEAPLE